MAQLGNLIVNGVSRLLSKLYVSDSVTAPSFIGKLTGNADTATKLTSSAGSATQPIYFSDGKPVTTTYTLGKSVPADAKFTDTNTWRGVQNNLTSTATDQSLSAAQGKVLKDLIDGKAPASHTHSQYYDSTISRTKGTVLAAPASANGVATFRTLTKSDVGLGSVDNTADSAKSVKAATKLQIYKQGSTTETYGDSYPLYAQWSGNDVVLKCDNYNVCADRASVSNTANAVAWGNVTGKPSTFTPSSHTHNYAGSSSAGGAATSANKVNAALTINLNGTSQGAWDGSSAKSISITAASVGATSVTISRW